MPPRKLSPGEAIELFLDNRIDLFLARYLAPTTHCRRRQIDLPELESVFALPGGRVSARG